MWYNEDMKKIALSKLKPAPWNPRLIKDDRFKNLCKSLENDPAFFDLRPCLATLDGTIYAGNMRYRAAQKLGWTEVPAILTDIPEILAKERAIKDNSNFGEYDDSIATIIDELEKSGVDLDTLGLDKQIEKIIEQLNQKEIMEDEVPEVPKVPKSKLGDLFILGDHRLLCGDATKMEDVEKLMNGEKADMVFTDPPYGVGYEYATHNDDMTKKEYEDFCNEWFNCLQTVTPNIVISPGAVNLAMWFKILNPQHIGIWTKANAMTHGVFTHFWVWEPVLFYGKFKKKRGNDLFDFPVGAQKDVGGHTCPKPLKLVADIVENFSEPNESVLDIFGGSGSTLIACEQLKRKCFMAEISEAYCDVIVKRWETFTGKKAVLESK